VAALDLSTLLLAEGEQEILLALHHLKAAMAERGHLAPLGQPPGAVAVAHLLLDQLEPLQMAEMAVTEPRHQFPARL
jgi:hypothetical protein